METMLKTQKDGFRAAKISRTGFTEQLLEVGLPVSRVQSHSPSQHMTIFDGELLVRCWGVNRWCRDLAHASAERCSKEWNQWFWKLSIFESKLVGIPRITVHSAWLIKACCCSSVAICRGRPDTQAMFATLLRKWCGDETSQRGWVWGSTGSVPLLQHDTLMIT